MGKLTLNRLIGLVLAFVMIWAGIAVYLRMPRAGATFSLSIGETRRALAKVDLPGAVFGAQRVDLVAEPPETGKLIWTVRRQGAEMLRYTAALRVVNDRSTQVTVSVAGPSAGANQAMGRRLDQFPAIRHLYITAMEEEIASTLEKRLFNYSILYPAIAAASASYVGALAAQRE